MLSAVRSAKGFVPEAEQETAIKHSSSAAAAVIIFFIISPPYKPAVLTALTYHYLKTIISQKRFCFLKKLFRFYYNNSKNNWSFSLYGDKIGIKITASEAAPANIRPKSSQKPFKIRFILLLLYNHSFWGGQS